MASIPLLSTSYSDSAGSPEHHASLSGREDDAELEEAKGYLSDRARLRHRLVLWPAILSLVLWGCTAIAFSIHAIRTSQLPLPLLSNATFTESELPALDLPPIQALGTFDRSKLAVIIEKRNLPVLIPVLLNFLVKVPEHWPFQIWCGSENEESLLSSRLLLPFIKAGRLNVTRLPDEDAIYDGNTLSKFLTAPWFWEQLAPANSLFFFQADSLICAHSNKTVDDFLGFDEFEGGYDWVGAPWDLRGYPAEPWGGNGGFSIRRRDTMLNITRSNVWNGRTEDVWFGDRIHETTARFPSQRLAMEFSFESPAAEANNLPWVYKSYGVHVGTGWAICRAFHDWEHITKLLEWCPDAKLVLPNDCIPQK